MKEQMSDLWKISAENSGFIICNKVAQ